MSEVIHAKYLVIVIDNLRGLAFAVACNTEEEFEETMKHYEEDNSGDYDLIVGYEA